MNTDAQSLPDRRVWRAPLRRPLVRAGPAAALATAPARADLPLQPSTWSVRAALAAFVSFELLFLLFVFAGRIKGSPHLAWIPIDLTGLFFVLSVGAGAAVVLIKGVNRRGLPLAFAMAALAVWVIASLLWTPGVVYAQKKALTAGVIGLWACVGPAVIVAAQRARVRRFLLILVLLAFWFAIEGALAYAGADGRSFVTVGEINYGAIGNTIGYGAVIVAVVLLNVRRFGVFKVALAALLTLFVFVILVVGARQPALGIGLALLVIAAVGFRLTSGIGLRRSQVAALGLLALAGGAVAVLILSGSMTQTLGRFETLFVADAGGRSAAQRQTAMAIAVHLWFEAPILGHGIGSFPILEGWVADESRHPHNLFLETLCELGLVGLALLTSVLLLGLRHVRLRRLREDPLFLCVFLLFVYAFSTAMVSGDLGDNRALFAMLGLLALPEPQARPAARAPARRPLPAE